MLKVFEAFSGVGAQRMALRNLGIEHEIVGVSEIDIPAINSYAAIHEDLLGNDDVNYPSKEEMIEYLESKRIGLDVKTGKVKLPTSMDKLQTLYKASVLSKCVGDISIIDPHDLPDMDLFTYSFPCQDLSVAGQRAGMIKGQTRSGLLYECEKIIEVKRPKYLLLENVKNLVGKNFKSQFEEWLSYLETLGYTNYWQILNAKDYGVPQSRERVFVISILGEHSSYKFPKAIPLEKVVRNILEDEVEERYYVNKPFKFVNKGKIKAEFLTGNFDQGKRIHGLDSYFQTLGAVERGTNNILVENEKQSIKQETKKTTDYRVRKLTSLECWRLMGFSDDDFNKAKSAGTSDSQLYKQAGNSIVVPVLEGIFRNLLSDYSY